jgi:glycosyltransferase involved in cell wall biosynthesis
MTVAERTCILVSCGQRQPTTVQLEDDAARDVAPRKDYVVLAGLLGADVIDAEYMRRDAYRVARLIARVLGMPAGQVAEAFMRRRRYGTIIAWADRLGLPLAFLLKVVRSPRRLVLISAFVTNPKKAFFLKRLRVDSHIDAVIARSLQAKLIVEDLGVAREKVYTRTQWVDERFWRSPASARENMICAVGWEARDYSTLFRAVEPLAIRVEVVPGSVDRIDAVLAGEDRGEATDGRRGTLPPPPSNVRLRNLSARDLRDLYARTRLVVVPVREVQFDAGVTAVTEAMAMGKPVIATRTPGLADLFEDGEAGLFVAPGDPIALRRAIERVLERPYEADRMGHSGRARVERLHRLDDVMNSYVEIVRSLR